MIARRQPAPPAPSVKVLLECVRDRLDSLIASHDFGVRDAHHYHELEQEAQLIARSVVAAFRGRKEPA